MKKHNCETKNQVGFICVLPILDLHAAVVQVREYIFKTYGKIAVLVFIGVCMGVGASPEMLQQKQTKFCPVSWSANSGKPLACPRSENIVFWLGIFPREYHCLLTSCQGRICSLPQHLRGLDQVIGHSH